MRLPRGIRWVIAVAVLIGLPIGYYNFILDWSNGLHCHKQFMLAFLGWMDRNGKHPDQGNNEFPNVGGVSQTSVNAVSRDMADQMEWTADYGYIPGLRQNDPGHLVLMYFNRPTRWTVHISTPTIFEDKEWILIPVDFCFFGPQRERSGSGECSERVSAAEFKSRLAETIEFIRDQKRPNWQTIVAEQTKFLQSVDNLSR